MLSEAEASTPPRKRKGRRFFDKLRMTEERKNPSEMKNERMKSNR